jgi:hypothetical protein
VKKVAILAALVLLLPFRAAVSGGERSAPAWKERSAGFLVSRPDVEQTADNTGRTSFKGDLRPGSGILYVLESNPFPAIGRLGLSMAADGCNRKSRDYSPGEARFPVSVTVVYGKDRQPAGWTTRAATFFGRWWDGFSATGIRLTYAWACGAPVGSMYRLGDEETVFVVAGIEEAGKRIASDRDLAADFRAAYGRPPSGPVTAAAIRLDRPAGETGPLKASLEVSTSP